jgi:hypothetical protein
MIRPSCCPPWQPEPIRPCRRSTATSPSYTTPWDTTRTGRPAGAQGCSPFELIDRRAGERLGAREIVRDEDRVRVAKAAASQPGDLRHLAQGSASRVTADSRRSLNVSPSTPAFAHALRQPTREPSGVRGRPSEFTRMGRREATRPDDRLSVAAGAHCAGTILGFPCVSRSPSSKRSPSPFMAASCWTIVAAMTRCNPSTSGMLWMMRPWSIPSAPSRRQPMVCQLPSGPLQAMPDALRGLPSI